MNKIVILLSGLFFFSSSYAQTTFPENGVKNNFKPIHAFTNATIIVSPFQTIKNGTLIIKDDKILSVDTTTSIPNGAIIHDLNGDYIYPSFIDLNSNYGILKGKAVNYSHQPQYQTKKEGAFAWNEAIHPEIDASTIFKHNEKEAEKYRNIGIGVVLSHKQDGIARGSGLLTTLSDNTEHLTILNLKASAHYSFLKGSSKQNYPSSLMGSIALLTQTYLDAEWYLQNTKKEKNLSLEAWNKLQDLPQFFKTTNKLNILRAWDISDKFEKDYIIVGAGDEYQRVNEISETNFPIVIPLNFPKPYDVSDPISAKMISLQKMKHWELAPANAKILNENDIEFAFTSSGLKNKSDFLKNVKKTIDNGLAKEDALAALTLTPAILINEEERLGTVEKNKIANFLICSGDIFEDGKIYSNWIQGKEYIINEKNLIDLRGEYLIGNDTLKISGTNTNYNANIMFFEDSSSIKVTITQEGPHINMEFEKNGVYRINALYNKNNITGKIFHPSKEVKDWNASFINKENITQEKEVEVKNKIDNGDIWFPNMAYGWTKKPEAKNIVFRNAVVWTNESSGILYNTDVAISNGKILAVGNNLVTNDLFKDELFEEIDANGKHLTSGIIDEHSHIAIERGVNEGTQASSAEVSIANVIKSNDVNIYRQLAGGVTTAQLLHGSANPIGGQSGIIKFRWGHTPEEMKFKSAPGFIKFALGENVKQSNWGDYETVRFPQTRMGVEQVFYDHFYKAKDYEKKWKKYNSLSSSQKRKTNAPREDLEMDALVEILNGQRFITCHSYVQSEINMLMKVADSMGFVLNTFTHILEGYKVAEKMKKHGAGASTFSDWWAYKFEVNDAIPYNAAILNEMGIVTAINSDDAEMARRLNHEAAKAVKYGGTSEEDAWKMITLNPAKLLHIDHKVGSIKVGKDADLVLWSKNPLSVYSIVEQTYIDGTCYYSLEKDLELREKNNNERNRLIQKMLSKIESGSKTQKVYPEKETLYHCDDMGEHSNHKH